MKGIYQLQSLQLVNTLLTIVSRVLVMKIEFQRRQQSHTLMKLVSVDSALKQLQNDSHFVRLCLIYKQIQTHLSTVTGTLTCKSLRDANCLVNFTSYSTYILTSLLRKMYHFKALLTFYLLILVSSKWHLLTGVVVPRIQFFITGTLDTILVKTFFICAILK